MISTQWVLFTIYLIVANDRTLGFSSTKQFVVPSMSSVRWHSQIHTRLFSMPADDYPSDYDADDLQSSTKTVAVDEDEDDAAIRDELKRELILLASVTNRGMCASTEESNLIIDLVTQLEVNDISHSI